MAELTKEQWAEIFQEREAGLSWGELAKKWGVPKPTIVSRYRRERQETPPPPAASQEVCKPCAHGLQTPGEVSQKNDTQAPKLAENRTNRAGISRMFGVALTTVDSWVKAGCPHDGPDFYTDQVYHWREEMLAATGDQAELTRNRARKELALGVKAELDNAERLKELAPTTLLTESLARIASIIAAKFDALPLLIKRRFPDLPNQVLELIKKVVAEVRNDVAANAKLQGIE